MMTRRHSRIHPYIQESYARVIGLALKSNLTDAIMGLMQPSFTRPANTRAPWMHWPRSSGLRVFWLCTTVSRLLSGATPAGTEDTSDAFKVSRALFPRLRYFFLSSNAVVFKWTKEGIYAWTKEQNRESKFITPRSIYFTFSDRLPTETWPVTLLLVPLEVPLPPCWTLPSMLSRPVSRTRPRDPSWSTTGPCRVLLWSTARKGMYHRNRFFDIENARAYLKRWRKLA